ncbi:MAG TPA: sigma-70 family RNA polymerase sigma factor [Chitinophagaceae bacterium]|nr:sigma-70 family RNA polymerase sigma factor [Chitinophagaceae bacterium]
MPIELSYTEAHNSADLQLIIASCARNERSGQEKLYKMFQSRMMSVAIRYANDRSSAEDIVNMGFLKCFQKIEKYNFQGSFEGWLRKIVLRTALDMLRMNEKYNDKVVFVEKEEFIERDHGDRMYYDQLLKLIETLPKTTKIVFNLSVMEGLQHKEIAELLGMSEGTSKWHLSEGRRILKEKIEHLQLNITQ